MPGELQDATSMETDPSGLVNDNLSSMLDDISSQGSASSLFGTTQMTGNAQANSISPEHLQSLSDVNVSQQDEFSLITPAQRGQDKILRSSQGSQDKNIGINMSATISGVTSGDNLPATFNGSQPTQPGRGGGLLGTRHSHLVRPASQPSQGGAGARSRQGDSGAMANMAGNQGTMGTINGSSMARWDEVAERMILITLPAKGRPYKRVDIENAIIFTGFPPDGVETLGEYERNYKWQLTVRTRAMAYDLIRSMPHIVVNNDKGRIECPVTPFKSREYRIRVLWYPDAGSERDLALHFQRWGKVTNVTKERINGRLGRYYSGARIITLIPTRDIEEIPDFMDISTMGRTFTVRLMVKGLLPRCHNCRVRGHLQRECTACSRCKSNDHATADHPRDARESFASKLRQPERQVDFVDGEEEEMDDISQASGQPAPVVAEQPREAAVPEPMKNDGNMNGDTGEGAASNRTPVDIGEGGAKPSPGDSEGKEGENATFKAPQSTSGKEEEGFVKVTNRKQRSSSSGNSGARYGVNGGQVKRPTSQSPERGPKRPARQRSPNNRSRSRVRLQHEGNR